MFDIILGTTIIMMFVYPIVALISHKIATTEKEIEDNKIDIRIAAVFVWLMIVLGMYIQKFC